MDFKQIFVLSFEAIKERKVRSALTILMVLVGSSLLVAVNGFGAGIADFFNKQFSNLAANMLFVTSVQQDDSGPGLSTGSITSQSSAKITLNAAVVNRISSFPYVEDVIPSYQGDVSTESRTESKSFSLLSIDPNKLFAIAPTLKLVEGSVIKPGDPTSMLVPEDIAFPPGESAPIITLGQSVRVTYSFVDPQTGESKEETKNFIVSGIIEPTGNPTIDNAVTINLVSGNSLLQKTGKFDTLFVAAESGDYVDAVEEQIRNLYGNDIGITTVQAILDTINETTAGLNVFLNSIAVISLVVGAVGIITTLYTSVVERIKEIGTLKAIGATNIVILSLFVIEAFFIGLFGATFGLITGMGMGYMLVSVSPASSDNDSQGQGLAVTPIYTPEDLMSVWLISVGLSVTAGLYPAWKASRYLPVEALRSQ